MLKCAFYEKEITPPLGCHIPGYFNLRQGSDVKDRLFARACVIDDGEKKTAIISVDDCTNLNNICRDEIKARITRFVGIPAENILLASTHSHTAIPSVEHEDADATANREGYFTVVSKLIADCAILAAYRLEDSVFEYACGDAPGIAFCRDYIMKNATPQTNPPRTSPEIVGPCSETDSELPIVFVKDSSNTPKGAIISFACHPDCVDGTEYSGDYISELSIQLKKVFGPDFVTVFLLGTCGDINHFDVSRKSDAPDHYRMMGKILAGEAVKAIAKAVPVSGDKLNVKYETLPLPRLEIEQEKIDFAKHCIETIKPDPNAKIAADNTDPDQYNLAMSKSLMRFLDNTPETLDVPVQFIGIGDFKLFAFPSEVFCCFGLRVKRESGAEKRMVSTLSNGSFGYIPSRDMFYDTIYESKPGACRLTKEAGYIMSDKLLEMGK